MACYGRRHTGGRIYAKGPRSTPAEYDIYYNEGISYLVDLLAAGVKVGVVQKAGSWLQFGDTKLGQGAEAARTFLKENPKLAEQIKEQIFKVVREQGIPPAGNEEKE